MGSFWGSEVPPGKTVPFVPPPEEGDRLHVSQASLGSDAPAGKRSILKLKVGDAKPLAICSLREGGTECIGLDLILDQYSEFSVEGEAAVHLTGYFMPSMEELQTYGVGGQLSPYQEMLQGMDEDDSDEEYSEEDDSEGDEEEDDESDELMEGDSEDEDDEEDDEDDEEEFEEEEHARRPSVVIEELDGSEDDRAKKATATPSQRGGAAAARDKQLAGTHSGAFGSEVEVPEAGQGEESGDEAQSSGDSEEDDGEHSEEDDEDEPQALQNGGAKAAKQAAATPSKPASAPQPAASTGKRKAEAAAEPTPAKKAAADQSKQAQVKGQPAQLKQKQQQEGKQAQPGKPQQQQQKKGQKIQQQQQPQTSQQSSEQPQPQSHQKSQQASAATPQQTPAGKRKVRRFENGFEIEEVAMGQPDGKLAKPGKRVVVRYKGKLASNGRVFDETKGKSTFAFRLGVGEVIKGWDKGVEGMRVGDKRRLTVPPQMAYGTGGVKGAIPPNATLVFDVELVDVK